MRKDQVLKAIRWTTVALMSAWVLYDLLILALISSAPVPKPQGFPLVWIVALANLPAVALALRYGWFPVIIGVLHWIVNVVVFQFGEQHASLTTAVLNSSIDFIFILLAVVCWLLPSGPRSDRISRNHRTPR